MPKDLSPDEKALVDEILRRRKANDRRTYPSAKVKRFRELIGAEIQRTGDLKREYVDQLLRQLRAGEL